MDDSVMKGAGEERQAQAIRRAERGSEVFARAQRHSRRVRVLKVVLPATAVLASAVFLGYTLLPTLGGSVAGIGAASISNGNLVIEDPALDGFTRDDLPYSVRADRALQAMGSKDQTIALEGIRATLPIDEQERATVRAANGTFDRENNHLTLDSDITFSTTSGLVARLRSARIDISSNALVTEEPVEIEMEGMRISADALRASEGGKRLIFENRVRVELEPGKVRPAGTQKKEGGGDG